MLESKTRVLRKWRAVLDGEEEKHTEVPLNPARFDESREQAGQVSQGLLGGHLFSAHMQDGRGEGHLKSGR